MLKGKDLNKLGQNDFTNVCRLCLVHGHSLREIRGTKIISMIEYCLDIKISSELSSPRDQLPTQICVKCFRHVTNFYTFKRKTEGNQKILIEAINRRSKIKDIINVALEKSDINTLELNELQKVATINDGVMSQKEIKLIKNKKTDDKQRESQNKIINLYKPVCHDEIYSISLKSETKSSSVINANSGTSQRQQQPLCFNTEPPPLVPLQTISELKKSTKCFLNKDSPVSQKISGANIILPPPLVSISPSIVGSEAEERIKFLNKLSCCICMKKFESLHLLQEHKLKSNCNLSSHQCNICKKIFMDQKKLIIHLKGHKTTKEYLCNICGKRYLSPSAFRIHFRSHTGERPFKCSVCGKGFVRWAGVKNHMLTHEDLKPYKCETCGKQFKVSSNLYRHQRLHTGNYRFTCSFCDKAFCQSDHLKLHIRTYHTNEKPYLCCECGKGFVSSQRLKRHELVHSGQKPYPCSLCLRAYSNAVDLKNHNLRVHSKTGNRDELKKYECSVCSLRFRHPCRLLKHMKTHNNLNQNCSACGHNFTCLQAFTRHLKIGSCKTGAQLSSN